MTARRLLILGGSTEASELARRLASVADTEVTVSYAGRTRERVTTPGQVRVGGFGGVEGLVSYLRDEHVDVVLDATHPFAAHMPHHAADACKAVDIPRLRICRPPWEQQAADQWHLVDNLADAAGRVAELGARRVFLTTGRQDLAPFVPLADVWFLVRAIEPPDPMPLADATVILARGPFTEAAERDLLVANQIDLLVSKNSGGAAAAGKVAAARALGVPVVMVRRPPGPTGEQVATVAEALAWLDHLDAAG